MPTSLTTLLKSKNSFLVEGQETNLEKGRIYTYTPGGGSTGHNYQCHVCWVSPGTGTALIEVWGAGGSGAKMCCCGFGTPGNPGAYVSKTINVTAGCIVCGVVGMSCGNSDDICFRGRSEPTLVCWFGNTTNGCMCAEGGVGGTSYCSTTPSMYCCYTAGCFCTTKTANENCGIICNFRGCSCANWSCYEAVGYAGIGSTPTPDSTCVCKINGGYSMVYSHGCHPMCHCSYIYAMRTPPKFFADCGAWIFYTTDNDNGTYNWSGATMAGYTHTLGLAGKNAVQGMPYSACWTGYRYCGCYNMNGCLPFVPPAFPGTPPHPCPDVRDHAYRGGHGIIRIKYIGTNANN
jgi:hypothetical protein